MSNFAFGTLPTQFQDPNGDANLYALTGFTPAFGDASSIGTAVAANYSGRAYLPLPAALSEFWLQANVKRASSSTGDFLIFKNGASNVFRVTVPTSTTVKVEYWDGSAWQELIAAQTLWSTAVHQIDIHVKIADSGGIFDLYVDDFTASGTPLLTFSGDTNLAGGTTIDRVCLGGHGYASSASISNAFANLFVIDDTDTRQCAAIHSMTSSAGTYSAWSGSESDIDDQANSITDAAADFISAAAVGDKESFNCAAPSSTYNTWDVLAVGVLALARYTGSAGEAQLKIKGGTAETNSADLGLTTAFVPYAEFFASDPDTAAAWASLTDANVQIGAESV